MSRVAFRRLGSQQTDYLRPHAGERNSTLANRDGGDSLPLVENAQQKMLSADVRMIECARFAHGEFENALRGRRVRKVRSNLTSVTLFQCALHALTKGV